MEYIAAVPGTKLWLHLAPAHAKSPGSVTPAGADTRGWDTVPAMSVIPRNYEALAQKGVAHYWRALGAQAGKQKAGDADRGNRTAVTGGKQMDGFCELIQGLVRHNGMPDASVYVSSRLELPGFFRPTKRWDLVVVHQGHLVAAVEFKSQVGPSFGNNFNNRTEEALGNAVDLSTAFREGAFGMDRPRPWVGWIMLLEDCPGSTAPVGVAEPHFHVFKEFRDTSYAKRYELLLRKLILEKYYDGAALILSKKAEKTSGKFTEPAADLTIKRVLAGLGGHVQEFLSAE